MAKQQPTETSNDLLQQIQDVDVTDTTTEESEETPLEETETVETETDEEITDPLVTDIKAKETETPAEKAPEDEPRYPIKVKGEIQMLTIDELKKYAQQGRFLEQERAKDREKTDQLSWEDLDKKILDDVKSKGYSKTHAEFVAEILKSHDGNLRETRKEARVLADASEWGKEPSYRERLIDLIDDGISPNDAAARISADYWQAQAQKGQQRGADKERKKLSAHMEKGKEALTEEVTEKHKTEAPTLENFEKLAADKKTPSSELLKHMMKAGIKVTKDTI